MSRVSPLILLLLLPGTIAQRAYSDSRPHVLLIVIDDLNDWLGCLNGHPQTQTPHIDRLAERGVIFTNAHCAAPACRPSRAALLSGMAPPRTSVWANGSKALLDQHPRITTLPHVFLHAGYTTHGTGKLIHQSGAGGRLFDEYYRPEQRWSPLTREETNYTAEELPTKRTSQPAHFVRRPGQPSIRLPLNGIPSDRAPNNPRGESFDWGAFDVPDSAMGDTQITDWAIERLNRGRQQPQFLAVGYYRPHIPLWAPRAYFERFEGRRVQLPRIQENDLDDLSPVGRRWALDAVTAGRHATVIQHRQWEEAVKAYLACVTFVDHQVGRLIQALDESTASDNTLIVLCSDHGWHLGEKQHWGKWTGWERSTRIPLIIVPPENGFASAGSRCGQPVSLLDLFPTLIELCDMKPPHQLDGQSLVPLLQDPAQESDRAVVTWFDEGNITVRTQHWRYLRYNDGSEELYSHQRDPQEWTNLASDPDQQQTLVRLRGRVPE